MHLIVLTTVLLIVDYSGKSPPTWYGNQWRSGDDIHSEWHDNEGHQRYCTQWRSGKDWRTICH